MSKLKVAVSTIGCKVNQYDSAAMLELFLREGFTKVCFEEKADVYIISTCTVTAMADKKSRQMINRARRLNGNAIVCAAGCLSQKDGELLKEKCDVDVIIGNSERGKIVSMVLETLRSRKLQSKVSKIREEERFEELSLSTPTDKTRAFVKVQEGCDNFCSYCIIPYVRGKARSRSFKSIVKEIENLVLKGTLEIVLTGIHVSSFGIDFENDTNLITLLKELDKIDGLKRLRLGSLEPMLIDETFCSEASRIESLCPHFHLSLQSGSKTVLERMNRKYTPEEYLRCTTLLRNYFDNPAITTDIIVGFPGETEHEFSETKKFVQDIKFSKLHVFPYSVRTGTKAATMSGQIPSSIKKERVAALLNLDMALQNRFAETFIGSKTEVLFEEEDTDKKGNLIGYTKRYVKVSAKGKNNEIRDVTIRKVHDAVGYE